MRMTLDKNELLDCVCRQMKFFFPDKKTARKEELRRHLDLALQRIEYCFSKINISYFREGSDTFFNHLHGDHYAMFLYFLANTIHRNGGVRHDCIKLFQLNRCLHSIDAYFEVELPDIFLFVHPLGTVLGRAKYSNYLLVYQQCNVGSNKNIYPTLKEYVSLHPGASILGNCVVEENCKIGAGSLLLDRNLEENSLYIGNPKSFSIKKSVERNPVWIPN